MDDDQVYGSLKAHNSQLRKEKQDFFFEHQIKNRIENLKMTRDKSEYANLQENTTLGTLRSKILS